MDERIVIPGRIHLDPPDALALVASLANAGVDCRENGRTLSHPTAAVLAIAGGQSSAPHAIAALRSPSSVRVVVIVVSDRPDAEATWRLLAAGADDVIDVTTPGTVGPVLRAKLDRWRELDRIVAGPPIRDTLIGRSPAIRRLASTIVEAARFSIAPVLIEGESGSGKELVAGLLHGCSPAADQHRAVLVDCSTLHSELALSELFGHQAGAFTGATQARRGAVADAEGGTLLLDEVGELPLPVQAHLLRFLQEGQFRPVGSNRYVQLQTRVVAATNRSLRDEVARGRFREDLYHRLASIHIRIPPLRDRSEDIPDLVEHFLEQEFGDDRPALSRCVADLLQVRQYPGNVRELRQLVRSIALRHPRGSGQITAGELPVEARPAGAAPRCGDELLQRAITDLLATGSTLKDIERRAKEVAIRLAIARHDGDRTTAARSLDVTSRTLLNHQSSVAS